ncbi:16S rRNA (adenine(1518)-N(6)/adenine(1519)-N(6))-dimethyltransferase RsmA [Segetibacter sp.]|jgi:16S rRNA (adenine1518-N6/adenine1519-N6)-dimethyltransferase|uniref:16S rRNA (adenine(1518)-N(6)/adenine(1519)-N(6))- dimethyltransferase RsmA n=1 Tax=Segetibacter sp. TaxID=2231182 RepID=UPI0026236717|nr:16S rRNA (adenine(1518)-N(6)/adenine(1519)-N(6))-dimethyltransferase RsmA [Segetibacter sp.]MCW3079656.1 rRNA ((1518)-N(6)/adenine(1519)-N(6)) -dimethyltransferase [Segetibacter sp.]
MEYSLKKSLGQHFLKDENVCKNIVDELQKNSFDRLLEVGPGGGALTKYLLKIPGINFKAVELDKEKVLFLERAYPAIRGRILNESFLDIDPPFEEEFTVVGNFPYNISTQILFKVLDWKQQVPVVVGMFQKEVAERAASKEGSKVYGVLSVLVQVFYKVEYLFDVDPSCFNPPPKVMSGVIRLTRRETVPEMKSEKAFINLVKTAFNQRRKTLRNAVKSLFTPEELKDKLFDKRAEVLSVEDFAALTFRMN